MAKGQMIPSAYENEKQKKKSLVHGIFLMFSICWNTLLKSDWSSQPIYSPEKILELLNTIFHTSQLEINGT